MRGTFIFLETFDMMMLSDELDEVEQWGGK